jgi:chromosome segregation ATPase
MTRLDERHSELEVIVRK